MYGDMTTGRRVALNDWMPEACMRAKLVLADTRMSVKRTTMAIYLGNRAYHFAINPFRSDLYIVA